MEKRKKQMIIRGPNSIYRHTPHTHTTHTYTNTHAHKQTAGYINDGWMQAVRSYLHFSQLSAWYNKTGGLNPTNILIRITIPGKFVLLTT